MKYYLVAGEASGDLHGANLMKELKKLDPEAEFRFFGGDLMQAEGGTLVKHFADMAFMGFFEVAANLRAILKNLAFCKLDIANYHPDVLILIDFPGFNLKIAAFAKENNLPVNYYISPKVWAWNQKRVLKIKKIVDHLFCILPFEVDFYKDWGMEVDYVGNPLLDAVAAFKPDADFLINYLLPDMIAIADQYPDYQFVIAGAPSFTADYYQQYLNGKQIPVLFNATYDILSNAHAAVVASGTATLEAALFNVPQIVVYKGNPISIGIARAVIKIKFISLVNLIMNRRIVKELIQGDCTPASIGAELSLILNDKTYRQIMFANYDGLDEKMGSPGASAKTAALVVKYAAKK
jgi:lipid-A-disaccharide synthase